MLDQIGDVSVVNDATSDAGGNVNADSTVSDELSQVATEELASDASSPQEQSETQEAKPEAQEEPAESKDVKQVRDWGKSLERDIKQKFSPAYSGIEKAATELFGVAEPTPEDIQATISTVQALAPSIKVLTDSSASQADVVKTLQKMLPQEHVEAMAWAALNDPATRPVIFDDPEVRQAISDDLFNGKSIEEVQALLANAPETEVDPEREAWRKEQADFKAERQQEKLQTEQTATQTRLREFADRFYESPAQRVIADDLKLVAPEGASEQDKKDFEFAAKAARFTAQALFIEQNGPAAEQLQMLHARGARPTADAIRSEINLANRYEATLIKTTEFFLKMLESRSAATVNGQQEKINSVRPDVKGSVDGNGNKTEERWDIDDPAFAQKFAASFHN